MNLHAKDSCPDSGAVVFQRGSIYMTTDNEHSGTLRTDYEADLARLDDFPALTADWRTLLHQLIRASRVSLLLPLLENNVLTVMADIRRKKLSGYGDTFADAQGTAKQIYYAAKLQKDIEGWVVRLENYLNNTWQTDSNSNSAVEIARQLKELLEQSLPNGSEADKRSYYRMLRTVTDLQSNADRYLKQAEESGDTEPALSLLIAYLKNYGNVADAFNSRLADLPGIYRRDILHAVPKAIEQDRTYVVITPTAEAEAFNPPQGMSFPAGQNAAGEDLIYRTEKEAYICPMQCTEVNAVYASVKEAFGLYKQSIPLQNITTARSLFAHGEELRIGWQITSPMLVLSEGEREVNIRFRLAADSPVPNILVENSFFLQLSTAEGWTQQSATCRIDGHCLCFTFTIGSKDIASASCIEEIHGATTEYPALRILTNNTNSPYLWAKKLNFEAVEIQTKVIGIRNFTFCNELGEVDTEQQFSPFGIQGDCGAWFLFGHEELELKPLQEVRLKGHWKKMAGTEAEFNELYQEYGVDASSFIVVTEYQKGGSWHSYTGNKQPLFVSDSEEKHSLAQANILFDFSTDAQAAYEYSRERDGFFRVTLQAPSIGFGTDAYRNRFTSIMIENSRCKEKKRKPLPKEPTVPMLADVELSYIASEVITLTDTGTSSIQLEHITALSDQEAFLLDGNMTQPFLPASPADHLLYFAFLNAKEERTIRMYVDMVLPEERIPYDIPHPDQSTQLAWEQWNGTRWGTLPVEMVVAEETAGLTQSGFIEIELPEKVTDDRMDKQGRIWLRASVTGDISACLAIRSIRTNCIRVKAQNGNGTPLPAGTIREMAEEDQRIASVVQPLSGFGGTPEETETQFAAHQSARFHNRHRAVTMKDYEQLVLEHFPEIDKAQCVSYPPGQNPAAVNLMVFSRMEDSRYFLSSPWKLAEIQRLIRRYVSPFVRLKVVNPSYQRVEVRCKVVLWDKVKDEARTLRQLTQIVWNYLAPWQRKGDLPTFRQSYSYKEIHARLANHEDVMRLSLLEIDGKSLPHVDYNTDDILIKGDMPWSILLPDIKKIETLSPHDGIEEAEIGGNFIIG